MELVSASVRDPAAIERVGRHELLLRIASGGMATVYLARMHGPHGFTREVALKLLHPHLRDAESDDWASAFIDEAKLAAQIRHPNVIPVLDVGDSRHGIFLVMEYVEGDSLHALLGAA